MILEWFYIVSEKLIIEIEVMERLRQVWVGKRFGK